jgi:GDP-L-fucose synthase
MTSLNENHKIFVAGHNGMVGSAIVRALQSHGHSNILTKNRSDLDLLSQRQVEEFIFYEKPDIVIDCAAKVGGIHSNNTYRADFIYSNLQIQNNLIHYSHKHGVKKLLFLGSSCIYPKFTDQPIKEEYLLRSPLEVTNEPYALAKIAGIKMCESYYKQYGDNFLSVMPCNQYGPNDNYHLENSHVLPALIRKFHEAVINDKKELQVWGTGRAKREFLHVDDLADACVFVLKNIDAANVYNLNISHLNIGSGTDISIHDLAYLLAEVTGYSGNIKFELDKPDGTLEKLMSSKRINMMGWKPKISLIEGIKSTYEDFKNKYPENIRSF